MDTAQISQLTTGVVVFFLGNISGYILHDVLKKGMNMNEESSKNFLLVIISLTWALSMIVDIISPTYDVPVAVHGIMGTVVGFFLYKPKEHGKK